MKIDKSKWKPNKLINIFTKREENDRENAQTRFDRFLKVDHMDAESLHIKRWSSQKEGEEINPTFYKIFRKGQILFPTRNPHLRRTVLASFDGICGEKTLTLEPKSELVLPEFIPFLFHSENFYAHTTASIIGSTNPHCRWRDVANYEFLLPPKAEQARLAELLWAIDDVIEKEKDVLEKLKIGYSSLRTHIYSNKKINKIVLGDYINILSGYPFKSKMFNNEKIGMPLVRIRDIKNSSVETFFSGQYNPEYIISKGDLIVGMDGDFIMNTWNGPEALLNQRVLKITSKEMNNDSILRYLNHFLQQELDKINRGAGATTVKHLSVKDITSLKLPFPENELKNVIRDLDLFTTSRIVCLNKISASQSLQKSLINQIF